MSVLHYVYVGRNLRQLWANWHVVFSNIEGYKGMWRPFGCLHSTILFILLSFILLGFVVLMVVIRASKTQAHLY